MTSISLAASYIFKAKVRLDVLALLLRKEAFSDVVREAQEAVELALKGMLRHQGIEPPKWHDVSGFLVENAGRFPESVRSAIPRLTAISKWLRKERELAFYGDIDFVPTEEYTLDDARRAMNDATFAVTTAESLLAL